MERLCQSAFVACFLSLATLSCATLPALGQEKSVRPGINKPFENPDAKEYIGKFEVESREVFAKRQEIVAACKLKPGMAVGDIGAGTGLFTRLFARAVGDQGKVYAVDIAPAFIQHIEKSCREKGIKNVTGIVCKPDSAELPPRSIDLAFICDTYHHFEFPFKTMASLHRALRPHGRVVLVDFKRIPGVSSEWVLNHVRAGQENVTKEIVSTGFKVVEEPKVLMENYCLVFEKVEPARSPKPQTSQAEDKLIATEAKDWQLTNWINSRPLDLHELRGKVILVRWWTGGGCPYCTATAPALKEFHRKYAGEGLVVLGVYHHKRRTPLDVDQVKQLVKDFGFSFPVAIDPGWRTLKRWWLTDSERQWTSVSFLIDRKGIIRHIHEGGQYVKGDKAYQAMRNKIEELLHEK